MKQFIKAFNNDGADFLANLFKKFTALSVEKLKAGILDETQNMDKFANSQFSWQSRSENYLQFLQGMLLRDGV